MLTPLRNKKILITRPAHQADSLCALIQQAGGQPQRFPTLIISEIADKTELLNCRNHLQPPTSLIFTSGNAVEKSLPTLLEVAPLPSFVQVFAIGKATTHALQYWGIAAHCAPPPYNSEALLTLPNLQNVVGIPFYLIKGEGGRTLLADTLKQRGAWVYPVPVYRRSLPDPPNWIYQEPPDLITVTSQEGLTNLVTLLASSSWLLHTPLIVISDRLRNYAQTQLGWQAPVYTALSAEDESIVATLITHALTV